MSMQTLTLFISLLSLIINASIFYILTHDGQ